MSSKRDNRVDSTTETRVTAVDHPQAVSEALEPTLGAVAVAGRSPTETDVDGAPPLAVPERRPARDDDRPTEFHDPAAHRDLAHVREQRIEGSTIREIMSNPQHRLSDALGDLRARARADLPRAEIDPRATLKIRHLFEFDRRVGYSLALTLFDDAGRCVEVSAELDQDGNAIRRGSMISKIIQI